MTWLKDLRAAIAEAKELRNDIRNHRWSLHADTRDAAQAAVESEEFLDALVERINRKQLERKD